MKRTIVSARWLGILAVVIFLAMAALPLPAVFATPIQTPIGFGPTGGGAQQAQQAQQVQQASAPFTVRVQVDVTNVPVSVLGGGKLFVRADLVDRPQKGAIGVALFELPPAGGMINYHGQVTLKLVLASGHLPQEVGSIQIYLADGAGKALRYYPDLSWAEAAHSLVGKTYVAP